METILASEITPADGRGTAAFRITLSETGNSLHPWVTHFQNCEYFESHGKESGKSWGHYFDNYGEALGDYKARVARGH